MIRLVAVSWLVDGDDVSVGDATLPYLGVVSLLSPGAASVA